MVEGLGSSIEFRARAQFIFHWDLNFQLITLAPKTLGEKQALHVCLFESVRNPPNPTNLANRDLLT